MTSIRFDSISIWIFKVRFYSIYNFQRSNREHGDRIESNRWHQCIPVWIVHDPHNDRRRRCQSTMPETIMQRGDDSRTANHRVRWWSRIEWMGLGEGNSEAPHSLLNRITRTERVYKFQVTKCEFYRVQSSRTEPTSNRTGPQFDSNSVHSSRTELEQKSFEPNKGPVRLD